MENSSIKSKDFKWTADANGNAYGKLLNTKYVFLRGNELIKHFSQTNNLYQINQRLEFHLFNFQSSNFALLNH